MRIPLTRGAFAEIDDEDYELVSKYKWQLKKDEWNSYATANTPKNGDGKRGHISMHRLIMGFPDCKVDHWDGNGLNNKKCNLRLASDSQNTWNQRVRNIEKSSDFKGVKKDQQKNGWACKICVNGKEVSIQGFATQEDAAKAYDAMARYYFGEFAKTNFAGDEKKSREQIKHERILNSKSKRTSRFHGVHFRKKDNKWIAQCRNHAKQFQIGVYDNELDAALAYNRAAIEFNLNVINDIELGIPVMRRML